MNKKRFLAFILIFMTFFMLVGCAQDDLKTLRTFWDNYVEAVNNNDLDSVSKFYSFTDDEAAKFKENNPDLLNGINSVQTTSFDVDVNCDISNALNIRQFYLVNVQAQINNGSEQQFDIYIRATNSGMILCTPINLVDTTQTLGNNPDELWTQYAYYQTDEYQYKYVYGETDAETEVTYVKNLKNERKVVIPSEINGYPVTSILSFAFFKSTKILSVTFPTSKLTEIEIPNTVRTIGNNAFYECKDLERIVIPESVASIGEKAFSSCSGCKSLTFMVETTGTDGTFLESTPGSFRILNAKNMLVGEIVRLQASNTNVRWSISGSASTLASIDPDTGVITALNTSNAITVVATDRTTREAVSVTIRIDECVTALTITADAFNWMTGLEEVVIYATNPNTLAISGNGPLNFNDTVRIYVPQGSGDMYKNHVSWSAFSSQIVER